MNLRSEKGFTIAEVVVAMMILVVGILAMMGTSTAVNKMIVRGRRTTLATQLAEQVLDSLRLKANANLIACTGIVANATGYSRQAVNVKWDVGALTLNPSGNVSERQVWAIVTYATSGHAALTDTVTTVFKCDV